MGLHNFEFEIDGAFFSKYADNEELTDLSGKIILTLEKLSTMLVLNIHIDGSLQTFCDRCGDELAVPVQGDLKQMVKFGETDEDYIMEDEIMIIPHEEHQIDSLHPIYECIITSIPNRRVHPEGECNEEALAKLSALSPLNNKVKVEETPLADPRWAALNKLKSKN